MNKAELIEVIAKQNGLTKVAAGEVLETITSTIVASVAKGEDVALVGFGAFKRINRAARTGRNPQTGKEIKIAATNAPKFTAGAAFKVAVSGAKAKPAAKAKAKK